MVFDGIKYAAAFLVAAAIVSYFTGSFWWGSPLVILALFCLWFFRDPERAIPEGPVAVSPADGKVVAVKPANEGITRISIFLNVFDVHVNRSPIGGVVTSVDYRKGKFLVASREDATLKNEQNLVTVEEGGTRVVFSQIAGLVARRIVCYVKPGDKVQKGDRIGLIKFGSRLDVFLGPEWGIEVRAGQRVWAGSSILARRIS